MISRQELSKYSSVTGFNLWQLERDYLEHAALFFLSKHSNNELVFKGGTALQKAVGLNRFSIDLDFTQDKNADLKKLFEEVAADLTNFGYPAKAFFEEKKVSFEAKFAIEGPLYSSASGEKSLTKLRADVSLREKVLLTPLAKTIEPVYEDLPPYVCSVMDVKEILAEKIRALATRSKPRDAYDAYFLFSKKIEADSALIEKKLVYCKKKYSKKEILKNLEGLERAWNEDLATLMTPVPEFQRVCEVIKQGLP